MAWFRKENSVEHSRLHNFLKAAFNKVKQDTTTIFSWINYFNSKHYEHDQRLAYLEHQFYYMPKSREEIKHIIDSHYSLEPVKERIAALRERIEYLEKVRHKPHIEAEKPAEKPKSQIREKLAKKIIKNSKDYLKSVIFSNIRRYGEISASKLREMVVEEQGLCSKSSFYRLLKELEQEESLEVINKGKEKFYILKNETYINK